MIISPPYLLARNADETDEAWIHRCMPGGQPGDGAYPLSNAMQWHGGLHLREPEANALVRAVADGEVVLRRSPNQQPAGGLPSDHPQAYRGGWTDNGVVVLKHTTEIGDGANASVTFFSIYMHLREIDASVQVNKRIYRKSPLGRAGSVFGEVGRLHFEIVCDDVNLQRLVGRTSGHLNVASNGRTDAVYGTMYFRLPAGTPVYDERPMLNNPVAHRQPIRSAGTVRNAMLQAAHTTKQDLFVGLRYAVGNGAASNRGDAYLNTYELNGTPVGDALEENDAEYNLYRDACAISNAYPDNGCPAPSAVYELLRFGRVIGPDALNPANVPHWRRIHYPGGVGWVNLNAANVQVFSDADFPHWMGWSLVDDSADLDSRCDSQTIKGWLDVNGDGKVAPTEALERMSMEPVASKLAKAICKFPTEWSSTNFDRRLGWIKTPTLENPQPADVTDFERLRTHIASLSFWPGNTGLPDSHWHWNPREFIGHFRKCGWLSQREMIQCVPLVYQANKTHRASTVVQESITTRAATERVVERDHVAFFKTCRKYGISGVRLAHFLAQIYQETGVLRWSEELASGDEYQGRVDLGNVSPGDGRRFKGRGLIQTTGKTNYQAYSKYRGRSGLRSYVVEPNNLLLSTDPETAADAAGLYWVSRSIGGGRVNINRVADQGVSEPQVRSVTRNVNGAEDAKWTGLVARRSHLKVVSFILSSATSMDPPERGRFDV